MLETPNAGIWPEGAVLNNPPPKREGDEGIVAPPPFCVIGGRTILIRLGNIDGSIDEPYQSSAF